jgi:hypothetical protein
MLFVSVLRAEPSGASAGTGAGTRTTQTPDTQPAAAAPAAALDPKGFLRAFAQAIRRSDADSIRAMVHAAEPDPQQLLDVVCDFASAGAAFKQAVAEKFGENAVKQFAQMEFTPVDRFAAVVESAGDKVNVEIEGDAAMLTCESAWGTDVVYLVKDAGQWKISADRMTENWSPDDWQQRTAQVQMGAEVLRTLAEKVLEGEYATLADLKRAIQEALNQNR